METTKQNGDIHTLNMSQVQSRIDALSSIMRSYEEKGQTNTDNYKSMREVFIRLHDRMEELF